MADKALTGSDVRTLTDDQLADKLVELKKEQFNLRFQQATGALENTARFGKIRKEIARVKTVQSERKAQQG